ncbi:MAG: GNAT family N-acetyltransferase [Deltaproteobacteria bacterium]|nr:GNAT family N-acetyltransferase [Deltaproteobacteria bacterium]
MNHLPMVSVLNHITIRGVRDEDAADITSIQTAITKSSENIDFRHVIEEQMRNFENVSFVAEMDGRVVGYMFSYILFGGFGLEKSAWIATLGVHPKFMGQGIGKRLAEEILTVYKDKCVRSIYTSVRWDSVDLLSFFKTLGFDRSHFINLKRELDV